MELIKKLLLSLLPDIIVGCLITLYRDDTGADILYTITLTVLALQALYLVLWFKGALWHWLHFYLFSQKEMIQRYINFLRENDFPAASKYFTSAPEDYFDAVANDPLMPQGLRLKASRELGSYEGLRIAYKLSTLMQLNKAFYAAIQFHNNRVIPDKVDDLGQLQTYADDTVESEERGLERQLTGIQVLKRQAEDQELLDNKERNSMTSNARKRIDIAENIIKKAELDSAISTLINETEHWPSWSQREDFDMFKSFGASNVKGDKSDEDDTYTVCFDFNESSYLILLKEITYTLPEDISKSAEVEVTVNGESVLKAELNYDYDREYNNWSYLKTTKLAIGDWMKDLIEIELQVRRHDKARFDKMMDHSVLKQAEELD